MACLEERKNASSKVLPPARFMLCYAIWTVKVLGQIGLAHALVV